MTRLIDTTCYSLPTIRPLSVVIFIWRIIAIGISIKPLGKLNSLKAHYSLFSLPNRNAFIPKRLEKFWTVL